MSAEGAMSALMHASRVDPQLRAWVREVEEEMFRLRAEVERLRAAMEQHCATSPSMSMADERLWAALQGEEGE